jgi:hypothetical protein
MRNGGCFAAYCNDHDCGLPFALTMGKCCGSLCGLGGHGESDKTAAMCACKVGVARCGHPYSHSGRLWRFKHEGSCNDTQTNTVGHDPDGSGAESVAVLYSGVESSKVVCLLLFLACVQFCSFHESWQIHCLCAV